MAMSHSIRSEVDALLAPAELHRCADIVRNLELVPKMPGIYGWWFGPVALEVPLDGTRTLDGYRLLYVGIAPARAPRPDQLKPRTLRDRLRDHCRGPIASSTLRRSLACLLQEKLGFDISRSQAGKLVMRDVDEAALSEWMAGNAAVGWVGTAEPWTIEGDIIQQGPSLPLNISGSYGPYRETLQAMRAGAGKQVVAGI